MLKRLIRENKYILFLLYWPVYLAAFFTIDNIETEHFVISCAADGLIPFNEYFVVAYALWFVWFPGCTFFFLWHALKPWIRREGNRRMLSSGAACRPGPDGNAADLHRPGGGGPAAVPARDKAADAAALKVPEKMAEDMAARAPEEMAADVEAARPRDEATDGASGVKTESLAADEAREADRARGDFIRLCTVMFTSMTISLIIYVVFPNAVDLREPILNDNLCARAVGLIRLADTPYGVCPSIHIATITAEALVIKDSRLRALTPPLRAAAYVVTLLITYSTMAIKQHSIVDVAAGAALAASVYFLYVMLSGKLIKKRQRI